MTCKNEYNLDLLLDANLTIPRCKFCRSRITEDNCSETNNVCIYCKEDE